MKILRAFLFYTCWILIPCCITWAEAQDKRHGYVRPVENNMSYLDNGIIRLGVDLTVGGAITFLEDKYAPGNMINNHDWGRQIQMSFYSGPIPFAPNGKEPHPVWKNLGWNPIQSGDCAGNSSRVLEHRNNGNEIYVKCIPMQWPLDNVPGECTFESWIRLEGNTVQVKARINNKRPDTTFYGARTQELPAIYTNIKFGQLATYRGPNPYSHDTISYIDRQNPSNTKDIQWATWQATEHWAANVNKDHKGLGIWMPGTQLFCGGSYGKAADSFSTKATATSYIAPLSNEILDHNIRYDYHYTLILGSLDEIRSYVYDHSRSQELPSFRFNRDRQHFTYQHLRDAGWPIRSCIDLHLQPGSAIVSPPLMWDAGKAPFLEIEAAGNNQAEMAEVQFLRFGESAYKEGHVIRFKMIPDNRFHLYRVRLADNEDYKGKIMGFKLIPPFTQGAGGNNLRIRKIELKEN